MLPALVPHLGANGAAVPYGLSMGCTDGAFARLAHREREALRKACSAP